VLTPDCGGPAQTIGRPLMMQSRRKEAMEAIRALYAEHMRHGEPSLETEVSRLTVAVLALGELLGLDDAS
jgi:hypothetical protein